MRICFKCSNPPFPSPLCHQFLFLIVYDLNLYIGTTASCFASLKRSCDPPLHFATCPRSHCPLPDFVSITLALMCPGVLAPKRPRPFPPPASPPHPPPHTHTSRRPWTSPVLTMGWEGLDPQPPSLVAHPLRAAFSWDIHLLGVGTVPAGQPHVLAAQGHTGEAAVLTAAADPAVGLEGLPIPVEAAVHLTAALIFSPCRGETGSPSVTSQLFPGRAALATSSTGSPLQSWSGSHWGCSALTESERRRGLQL